MDDVEKRFAAIMADPENHDICANSIYDFLIDDVILGMVFEVHQALKFGVLDQQVQEEDTNLYSVGENCDSDIFSPQPVKKSDPCCCPSCDRPIAACKIALHLDRCMNLGRNSSRLASQRIAKNSTKTYSGMSDDDEEEGLTGSEKAKLNSKVESRKKQNKNVLKKNKNEKPVMKDISAVSEEVEKIETITNSQQVKKLMNDNEKNNLPSTSKSSGSNLKPVLMEPPNQPSDTVQLDADNTEMDLDQPWETILFKN